MKPVKRLGMVLILTALAPLARAADPLPAGSNLGANAALKYWAAIAWTPSTDEDSAILRNWQQTPLDEKSAKMIESNQVAIQLLHAGAAIPQCDWGLDLSEGPMLRLPHLGKSRALGQFACLLARNDFQQQQPAAAIEIACDTLTLARHCGGDPITISILVNDAIEQWVVDLTASHLKTLDPETLKHLGDRLNRLPTSVTVSKAIKLGLKSNIQWTIRRIQAAGAHPDWNQIFPVLPGDAPNARNVAESAGGTPEAVIQQLQAMLPLIDEMGDLASLSQEDFHKKFSEARGRFDANVFAKQIFPSLARAYDTQAAAATRLALLQAAIAVVQRGPEAIKEFQDPIDHRPLEYQPHGDGFQLSSKVTDQGKPVMLTVGS